MKPKYFSVAGLLVACLFGATASLWSSEPCRNWDASGFWKLDLPGKYKNLIEMHVDQKGNTITGRASLKGTFGDVVGTVGGASVNIKIKWSIGTEMILSGTIAPNGRIQGSWFNMPWRGKPDGTWVGDRAMLCKDTAPPTDPNSTIEKLKELNALGDGPKSTPAPKPTPVPKTVHHTGPGGPPLDPNNPIQKKMLDKMEASRAEAAAKGTPTITANPRTVSIPAGQSEGTTTLTWDGGSEHPYAEVWVKAGDEDEKFVVEKGKGTRQVKVAAGKTYLYILTDSGKRLSTVTVTGK
jgi:hypothetical protein